MDISVLIPVYNEENNVGPLFSEIKEALDPLDKDYEVLFINDGSTDGTLTRLKELKTNGGNLKIVDLTRNFGQTQAIMAGFDSASGNVVVTLDGDLQNDPRDIPSFIEKIGEGYDLVCGWRRKRKDNFLFRTLPSRIANRLINLILKTAMHDYGCTLKAYKKSIINDLQLYGEMHRFIPAVLSWKGAKISEIEVNHRPRRWGNSKYGLNRTVRVILDLLLMAFLSEYSTKPIRFFGGIGIFSSMASAATLLIVILMKVFQHKDMTGNPLLILCVLFFLVGVQFISMGFLGEINIRTYYESQGRKTYHIREIL